MKNLISGSLALLLGSFLIMSCSSKNAAGKADNEAGKSFRYPHVEALTAGYFQAVEALAQDNFEKTKKGFDQFHHAIDKIEDKNTASYARAIIKILDTMEEAKNIEDFRMHLQALSYAVYQFLSQNEIKLKQVHFFKCPMVPQDRGVGVYGTDGYWISIKGLVENPYHGAKMFACGSEVEAIAP